MLRRRDDDGEGPADKPAGPPPVFVPARCAWILTACIVWSGVVCARLAQYMVVQRQHFVALMESEAWEVADVPALRGRILDRNGRPLAWSTRHFRALFLVPEDAAQAEDRLEEILRAIPGEAVRPGPPVPGQPLLVADDPPPSVLAALQDLAAGSDDLRVESYTRRHRVAHPGLRRRLGQVKRVNGRVYGVSGEEKRHDHLLRGSAGKYRVMTAGDGSWIPGTWETLRELRPGYDVYLNLRFPADSE